MWIIVDDSHKTSIIIFSEKLQKKKKKIKYSLLSGYMK